MVYLLLGMGFWQMKFYKLVLMLLALILIMLLSSCSFIQTKSVRAKNGILDMSKWDFSKNGNINIDGEWEFYWNKLYTYSDLISKKMTEPLLAPVPLPWTEYDNDGGKFPGKGYGTYRLHIISIFEAEEILSLRVNTFSSSYKIYIDDKEIASNGIVSDSKDTYVPQYRPLTTVFSIPNNEFDIIIQVANYDFYKGGYWYSISMGTADTINNLNNILFGKELFIIGSLSVLSIYYFSIFIINKKVKIYLYFSIICVLAILIFDVLGEVLICRIAPDIPFKVVIFIWYASLQWLFYFLILYVGNLFFVNFNKTVSRIFGTINIIVTAILIFTPVYFYTKFGLIGNFIILSGVIYSILLSIIGLMQKKQGAILYNIAIIILFITVFHDVLYISNIINNRIGGISFIGIFIFLIVHTIIHAKRSALEYEEKVRLLSEVEKSKEIAIINERKFLQAQIKPHFLFNTLSVIASLSTRDPAETRTLIVNLAEYLRSSFDFVGSDDLITLDNELELVKAYIVIQNARFRERINFILKCDKIPDIKIPRLSIQPLVENAIQHGILPKSQGGNVILSITEKMDCIAIEVFDDGKGMPEKLINDLLDSCEDRRGIGVRNINKRLISLYGKGLVINSEIDNGSCFGFEVPLR